MTVLFHLECTIAMRRDEPSKLVGAAAGPLMLLIVVVVVQFEGVMLADLGAHITSADNCSVWLYLWRKG